MAKRRLSQDDGGSFGGQPSSKRRCANIDDNDAASTPHCSPPPPTKDIISTVSDEIIVRILSYMSETALLDVSLVSKRFHAITSDSQLWRPHYYRRFILPRAHRIPGYKAASSASNRTSHNTEYRAPAKPGWDVPSWRKRGARNLRWDGEGGGADDSVDWKKQYRLRHNWARGRCAVEEVRVHAEESLPPPPQWQTLVKVVEGIAVTADSMAGLRAWDLRTRKPIAQAPLKSNGFACGRPSCLAVDDALLASGRLDVAVGFCDGTFGIWRLDARSSELTMLYRQEKSFLGKLAAAAYAYPYLLTATQQGFISLYTFNRPTSEAGSDAGSDEEEVVDTIDSTQERTDEDEPVRAATLGAPYLVTSLKSHNTRSPLALSIRKMASSAVASIAYTFDTVGGWSIGIQDLDVRPSGVVTSRVASTLPTETRRSADSSPTSSPARQHTARFSSFANNIDAKDDDDDDDDDEDDGPTRLCYSHPYLLATLPDNTLVLHLCTSTATSLSISKGMRLWGHTSGISDAEITPRGKAVSVSTRGDEIRLWELEGRVGGRSVEVRPRQQLLQDSTADDALLEKRNWVGFDEEMVVVLKEAGDGRDSLMVYDFT